MSEEERTHTKGERREAKRLKRRRMKVAGAGVKRLQAAILRRAAQAAGRGEASA